MAEIPAGTDMKIESEETDLGGISELKITALTEQAQIDLAMEYPRILKLLNRLTLGEEVDEHGGDTHGE